MRTTEELKIKYKNVRIGIEETKAAIDFINTAIPFTDSTLGYLKMELNAELLLLSARL